MAKYRIVAARPKNASNHVNSQFKMYEYDEDENTWNSAGWKSISEVSSLMHAGQDVRTGKIIDKKMKSGAAVELELRIAKNETVYKISDMPES